MTNIDLSSLLPDLHGRTVLIAEDEYLLAADLARFLERAGAHVVGPFPSLKAALEGLRSRAKPDYALLDVNLRGEMVFPLADALMAQQIPFVLITGYDAALLPAEYGAIPRLEKPIRM